MNEVQNPHNSYGERDEERKENQRQNEREKSRRRGERKKTDEQERMSQSRISIEQKRKS